MSLFAACSTVAPVQSIAKKSVVRGDEKAFAQEDNYIILALSAQEMGDHKSAAKFFNYLYKKSMKKEYLYGYLQEEFLNRHYVDVIEKVDATLDAKSIDTKLLRYKVMALIELNRLQEARKLAKVLADTTQETRDYLLVSDTYTKAKEYNLAVTYLDTIYKKAYNEDILERMATILYVDLHKKKEAIAKLEAHEKVHGCREKVCKKLLAFYAQERNVDALLAVYKRLYSHEKSEHLASKIIEIYLYKKEYVQLIDFLEKNHIHKKLLLQLYVMGKDYKAASRVALQLYRENGNISYLGESAIYRYESAKNGVSDKLLKDVIANLRDVVKIDKEPLYLNYLGYILIDHNVNVKEGMRYIRQVLKIEPNSAYYLDSLAWGYYKLGKCYKAQKIMKRVAKLEGGDAPEVKEHINIINRCVTKHKKVKKRT